MKAIYMKIARVIINIITVIVLLLLSIVIIAKVMMLTSNKNYIDIFGYSVFNVITGSMEPTIKINDIVIVKNDSTYGKDDIITYQDGNSFVTHRIISINDSYIVTRGDANNTSDKAIERNQIIGKVVKIYSGLGIWQNIFTTPSVYISIFITIILFDLAFSYKGKDKEKEEPKKEVVIKNAKVIEKQEDIYEVKPIIKEDTPVKLRKEIKRSVKEEVPEYTIRLDLTKLNEEILNKIKTEDK